MLDLTEFLQALHPAERVITLRLRQLILEADPKLIVKYNDWVPYYVRNKMVCFVWPVSTLTDYICRHGLRLV